MNQPSRPTQLAIPPGVDKLVVIHVITRLETIKRQTRDCEWLFGRRSKSVGVSLAYGL